MLATNYTTFVVKDYKEFYQDAKDGIFHVAYDQTFEIGEYDKSTKSDLEKIQAVLERCNAHLWNVTQFNLGNGEISYMINALDFCLYFKGGYINFNEDGVLGALDSDQTDIDGFIEQVTNNNNTLYADPLFIDEGNVNDDMFGLMTARSKKISEVFDKLTKEDKIARLKMLCINYDTFEDHLNNAVKKAVGEMKASFDIKKFEYASELPKFFYSIAVGSYIEDDFKRSEMIFGKNDKLITKAEFRTLKMISDESEVVISFTRENEDYVEVVKWISDEWIEDSGLLSTIFNVISRFANDRETILNDLGYKIIN